MGTIMNLKDFRKELELLEHDNENPIADVWYDEILRGKSIFPGQPEHIKIWWGLDDNEPEQKRIKDNASILKTSSFVDIEGKKILVYDDREDYSPMFGEGEWIIMPFDDFLKWIVEYADFFNRPIQFEYEPIGILEYDDRDGYIGIDDDLSSDEIIKIKSILDCHTEVIWNMLQTYEDDISSTILSYYFERRKIDYELETTEYTVTNKIEAFIDKLLSEHDIKNCSFTVEASISYKRWDYPGEVSIGCAVIIELEQPSD